MAPIALDDEALRAVEVRASHDLGGALAELPEEQREAVLRRVLADESYTSIATSIGTSEQVVRQRVSRGLARLRASLEHPA